MSASDKFWTVFEQSGSIHDYIEYRRRIDEANKSRSKATISARPNIAMSANNTTSQVNHNAAYSHAGDSSGSATDW